MASVDDFLLKMEREIMVGKWKWIADFTESFMNFRVRDVIFDRFIKGTTRVKGFFLSRIFSYMILPNYSVGCFMLFVRSTIRFDRESLYKLVNVVKNYAADQEMKWAWLILIGREKFPDKLRKTVESFKDATLGVLLVELNSKMKVHSDSYISRQAVKYIKI